LQIFVKSFLRRESDLDRAERKVVGHVLTRSWLASPPRWTNFGQERLLRLHRNERHAGKHYALVSYDGHRFAY
jgi:hypothetical protein